MSLAIVKKITSLQYIERILITGLSIIALIFILLYLISSFNQYFTVQSVFVDGDWEFSDEIEKLRGVNLIFLNTGALEQDVKNRYIRVDSVKIVKEYPRTVHVQIKKKQPLAQIEQANLFYVIDPTGLIFSVYSKKQNLPVITGLFDNLGTGYQFEASLAHNFFPLLLLLKNQEIEITDIKVYARDRAELKTTAGVLISYSTAINPTIAVSSLQMMFQSFRIEGKFPKRVDILYDKPVVTF